jgi:glycosyltransferase involved in cell wall biosynthesis
MEISSQLVWNYKMKQNEFLPWLAHAKISLAPLVECTRNLVQGCCPLKIVESMAYSVPVVASDLPVVRELIEHKKEGWLVRPDRPSELARAIRLLLLHSSQAEAMAKNAQAKVSDQLSWAFSRSRLEKVYAKLG